MPRTLYDDDGNKVEVPTEEEQKATLADATKKAADEAVAKAQADFEQTKKDLESQVNPNWKKFREAHENLKKAITASGKQVDDDGNVIDPATKPLTKDEIAATAAEAADKSLVKAHINRTLSKLSADDRKLVMAKYDKLVAGENVTLDNVNDFLQQAGSAAFGTRETNPLAVAGNAGGQPPRLSDGDRQNFAETDEGKSLAKDLQLNVEEKK